MKYIITGSIGHISKPLSEKLVNEGHSVTIISSKADKRAHIEALGATAAIGSIEDVAFLTQTFKGADAIYTMVPPKWDAPDWKTYIHQIGKNYALAIEASGVKKVVNLSSLGAHMPTGCGPVSGLFYVEKELNALHNVDIIHLRPAYYYHNLMSNIGMIKHMGIIGANYGEITMVKFTGNQVRYIASDERSTHEIATVLGKAIGNPSLPWVNFSNEDALNGMLQAGLPTDVANNYVEMGAAMASGEMATDYLRHKPTLSKIKLEDFALEFAAAYANA